jgi:hypothetical protein
VVMLSDTGSTHNFFSTKLVEQLGVELDKHNAFEVMVANRERLSSQGKCSAVPVWLEGTLFTLEFFSLISEGTTRYLGCNG